MQIVTIYFLVILCCIPLILSIRISPCAKWNTEGITVAGNGIQGNSSRQLSFPQGIFIHHRTKRLYVSDSFNNRIQIFPLNRSTTSGVTLLSKLRQNFKIYVDDDDVDFPTMYIAMNSGDRVEKWMKDKTVGIPVGDRCRACTGVWLDGEKNVYMSENQRDRILKWSPVTNITKVIAGVTDTIGPSADQLNKPEGIVVDKKTNTLYIADLVNHRVQKWIKDANEGVTVAGSSEAIPGSNATLLERPYGLRFDEETRTLYIVDLMNNRIQRWKEGATEGETIAGGNGQGSASDQFYHPTDLDFDDQGNLYVSEGWNHRVQFFALIDNEPCYEPPTTTSTASIREFTKDLFLTFILTLLVIQSY